MKSKAKILLAVFISVMLVAVACAVDTPLGRTGLIEPGSYSPGEGDVSLEPPVERTREGVVAQSNTYYVRPDGGSISQCTGLVNAPYSGSGSNQSCAWSHPFIALPPGGTPHIAGGDTLVIASGSYMMGYGDGAPDPESYCDSDGAFDCFMTPIPSGPDAAHPTRILGAGWDSGCANPPELWGTQRAVMILNLTGTSNLEVACLEITDHAACVEDHAHGYGGSTYTCERQNYPFGEWADTGISAEDSANVTLRDLNIHGLSNAGIRAGRLTDWNVQDVRIAANGWVGWEGDIEGEDSNSGTITFQNWLVEWNGCVETYPGGVPTGCWSQSAGGYGDGVGTGATGGHWIIRDSQIMHNTSDGLDLLYHTLGGSITLERVRAEGNAGQQVKVTGDATITNSVMVGNCTYFDGQPFTYDVDPCRAQGNTLHIAYTGGESVSLVNNTIYGQGDGLVMAVPRDDYQCNGTETLTGSNNIFHGDEDALSPGDITFIFYQENCGDIVLESDFSIAYNIKNNEAEYVNPLFPSAHNLLEDPQLEGPLSGVAYGMQLAEGSPAIDTGDNAACPATDYNGVTRLVDGDDNGVAVCDMGAYEFGGTIIPVPTPTPPPTANSTLYLPMTWMSN